VLAAAFIRLDVAQAYRQSSRRVKRGAADFHPFNYLGTARFDHPTDQRAGKRL
jgi:hypothetical protein